MFDNIFHTLFIGGFLIGAVIRTIFTKGRRKDRIRFSRVSKLDIYLLFLPGLGMILPVIYIFTDSLSFADYVMPVWLNWIGWVGALTLAGAQWLLVRSHIDLGRNWSPVPQIKEDQTLVTDGVFRYIRHPMYAAHWLWAIAQLLMLHNWIAGPALFVFLLPMYLTRVSREEEMMLEHFGDEYREYMDRTGRLIPRF